MECTDWSLQSKVFFSLEGVDIKDDYALAAFAQRVWEQVTTALVEEPNSVECKPHP